MGGATGIGLLLSRVISLPLSSLILAVNAFLFVWGTLVLGKKFALTTIVQYLCLSGIFVCGTDDTRDYRADR